MRNLLLLLLRYSGFITFIALEAFCMFLVVRYNRTQREIFANSSNLFVGAMYKQVDGATRYWNLTTTADSLAAENARLRAQLTHFEKTYLPSEQDSIATSPDSLQQYQYIAARVINNSTNRNNNIITIEKGAVHGIKKRQGVISDNGIVGIVRNVNQRYSTVLSILHRQLRISVAIKRNNFIGSLAWRGNDPTVMKLEDVPVHADLQVGDTIITSGYTPRFSRGIMVGVIETFERNPGRSFYDIDVKLSNDLNNIRYVYAVDNRYAEDQETLEEAIPNGN